MKINTVATKSTPLTQKQTFGMALYIKSRAINNSAVFPNVHAEIIRQAVSKSLPELEKLAKSVDLTIDMEPSTRGLDWTGERNFLSVTARKLDETTNQGQLSRLFNNAIKFFTEPIFSVNLEAAALKETNKPEEILLEMAKEAKTNFLKQI